MNRADRRAIERAARRQPRQNPGAKVMAIPLAFGATPKMLYQLGLKDRQAVDAVISGKGAFEDLQTCTTMAVTAAHACCIAQETAELAALVDGLAEVRDWLAGECMASLASIFERQEATGRIGVSATERAALLQLADIADDIRRVLPRRVLHEAFTRALKVASLRAALGLQEVVA